ncbi:hypothetical protein Pmani_018648 [Petrolisthes manimaculis]|uniref:Dehydrogenase/reductase SDR family protein 7-like n=1 Tax=Petrolisthes manimaculis TaxID=1843537 RepID=A0AAE1PJY0_9EUCA|nr:hypothetical protein Pmani_018648 [Petrolisthes manimaculis]
MTNTTSIWIDLASFLGHALENTRAVATWSSLPWILGWVTLTVMGPVVAVKVVYRTLQTLMSWAFSSDSGLRGKIVLVTGASSGVGEAVAHALYRRGARLILASRNTQKLNDLKEILLKTYKVEEVHVPTVVKLDLEDINSIPGVVTGLLTSHGHIDILINNAGMSYRGAVIDTDVSVDIRLMVVNYFGHVALTKALLPSMVKRKSGHIVGVSSLQGKLALPFRSCYSASKHAMQGFYDSLRAEVADSKILVSVVSPGYISTNLSLNAITKDGSTYGISDKANAEGMKPETVAESIVNCLLSGQEDMVLAPAVHQLGVILHTLTPTLISRYMKHRANQNRKEMIAVDKEK